MLNYVRQDEEFYCHLKLVSNDEIMGKCVVHFDDELQKRVVFVQEPVQITIFLNERPDGKTVRGIGFTKWMQFSDEDFFIITEDHVVSMASLAPDMIEMYEKFLVSEEEDKIRDEDMDKLKKNAAKPEKMLGHIGTIEEARKKFEDMFKL